MFSRQSPLAQLILAQKSRSYEVNSTSSSSSPPPTPLSSFSSSYRSNCDLEETTDIITISDENKNNNIFEPNTKLERGEEEEVVVLESTTNINTTTSGHDYDQDIKEVGDIEKESKELGGPEVLEKKVDPFDNNSRNVFLDDECLERKKFFNKHLDRFEDNKIKRCLYFNKIPRSLSFSKLLNNRKQYYYLSHSNDNNGSLTRSKNLSTSAITNVNSNDNKTTHDINDNAKNIPNDKEGVTLCTLGVGTTFGASVMPGKSHSVSVVTSDDCTLLRVRRADFQEIFNEQSHLINNVESSPFCSFTSLNRSSQQQQQHQQQQQFLPNVLDNNNNNSISTLHNSNKQHLIGQQERQKHERTTSSSNYGELTSKEVASREQQQQQLCSSSQQNSSIQQPQIALRRPSTDLIVANYKNIKNNVQEQSDDGAACSFDQDDSNPVACDQQQQQDAELVDLNLDSIIESNELPSYLMRIGWVLRTLMLSQCPKMVQNRRIHLAHLHYYNKHHLRQHQQQQQARRLVSVGSSSQVLPSSGASCSPNTTNSSNSKSTGRKVANYVASSFMRSNSKLSGKLSGTLSNAITTSNTTTTSSHPQQPLFSSNSFDSNTTSSYNNFKRDELQHNRHYHHHHQQQQQQQQYAAISAAKALLSSEPVLFKRSMLGREMVDWLLELSQSNTNASRVVSSRLQAISMWQVLLEQGIIFAYSNKENEQQRTMPTPPPRPSNNYSNHLDELENCCQFQFCDDQQAYYKFWFDRDPLSGSSVSSDLTDNLNISKPTEQDVVLAHESLWWGLKVLSKLAPDALFRLILSKRPYERSLEEIDIVFEELQHLKALSHLTNSVKKELAACVSSELHLKHNTVIFNQGDPGHSWYIILRGSVNVVIVGKGVVCTLHHGDDFGKLALVNDAPRAATIVTNESNCFFLRVDKQDFNTILRDVEANTVRLKEHGKEVLILQKMPVKEQPPGAALSSSSSTSAGQQQPFGTTQEANLGAGQQVASSGSNINALPLEPIQPSSGGLSNVNQQQEYSQVSTANSGIFSNNSSNNNSMSLTSFSSGPTTTSSSATTTTVAANLTATSSSALKYMVMAGTAEKMLEHLLETRIDGQTQIGPLMTGKSGLIQHDQVSSYIQWHGDNFLEDFILTHKIFMPTGNLCNELLKQYQCQTKSQLSSGGNNNNNKQTKTNTSTSDNDKNDKNQETSCLVTGEHASLDDEYLVAKKRRVVKFIRCWMLITREHFFQQQQIQSFLTTIHLKVKQDAAKFASLQPELKAIARILELHLEEDLESRHKGVQRWIDDIYGNILPLRRHSGSWELNQTASKQATEIYLASLHCKRFEHKLSTIQNEDEVVFRVYCADHSFTTLKTRIDEKAAEIKLLAANRLNLLNNGNNFKELILVHVKSNGERIIYNDLETNISTSLSVNGRIFVCPLDHISSISPIPEQDPFQEVYQSSLSTNDASGATSNSNHNNNSNTGLSDITNNTNKNQGGVGGQSSITTTTTTTGASNNTNNSNNLTGLGPSSTLSSNVEFSHMSQQQQAMTSGAAAAGSGGGITSHLLASTPTNYADIKTQMSLSVSKLEEFSSRDVAYCLTQLAWSLLKNMHEFELIYTVFGRHNFKQITANLNVFLRHFNEIQYWVVTQICLSTSLSKRVQILRKFIKIAAHCKELQNLNAFFAIIMGLSNMAVARLTQAWEKLPNKLKRTFSQFESLIDPSRNHRRYRIFISKMEPPIIPFMPLFLKDMTFAHEGNKTYLENGLINFEKMQMVAQTLRTIRYCKSRPMKLDSSACKFKGSIRTIELFFRDLKIIDNQRTLTQMSHQLEHRKT